MLVFKFAYVGEFTSRPRRVGVGEFARRRVDRIRYLDNSPPGQFALDNSPPIFKQLAPRSFIHH